MNYIARWLVSLVTPAGADLEDPRYRARVGLLEGWIAVVVNSALALLKGALGLMVGSVALLGDAINNLSDLVVSIVVILGFRMSQKPADEKHPFGHGRMENIAGIIIGVLFAVVAFEVFKEGFRRMLDPRPVEASNLLIGVLLGTMAVKAGMARLARQLGDMIRSETLYADAWNHRMDVLATGVVVAGLIGARWNIAWLDGGMGMVVSGFIAWAAFKTLRGATGPLLGEHAPETMYQEIEDIARAVPGVKGVHDILVNRYGSINIISLHIEVSDEETALRLHEMSDAVETKLGQRYAGHATVHVDPLNLAHEHYDEVRSVVSRVMAAQKGVISFHDLRLIGDGRHFKVVFDVAVRAGSDHLSARVIEEKTLEELQARFPHATVVVELEPPYFRNVPGPD